MIYPMLQQFLPAIKSLNTKKPLTKNDLLNESFLLNNDGDIKIYYAPHNEYINKEAKIIIVGITPGWNQMKTAFEQFVKDLSSNNCIEASLIQAKISAGFAGSMRTNLVDMLDQCNIPRALNIQNSSSLFSKHNYLIHTTSVIKYPVFFKEKNYTGHQPPIDLSPLLRNYAYKVFPKELAQISPTALVIPLGRTVENVIFKLGKERKLPNHTYLIGFPHPSGANGHRIDQFQQQKDYLREKVKIWADRS